MVKFNFSFSLVFLFAFCLSFGAASAQIYQNTIYTEKVESTQYQQSLNDLALYLKKVCGQDFKVQEYGGKVGTGIYILWNKRGLVSDELFKKLSTGSIEDFILSGADNRLLIIANHPLGFSRAIYTYLDKVGVKWYFPGDDWEYVPIKKNISLHLTEYCSPSFQLRNFFGTGGIRQIAALDPNSTIMQQWEIWKRRNRMGGEIDPAGHYGETFNAKYKDILERHPEYLAFINGRRDTWSPSVKWCISNKEFRQLFINDRVEELRLALKQKPANEKILLTVDPPDGAGDCTCENCTKIGSSSDLYYYLANEVTTAIEKISPRAYANIYAYNTHSAVPHFKLQPNLIVQIVPYAFQNVGSPEYMLDLWKKHHSNLLIYDYYVIPDWQFDLPNPRKTSPDTLANRIKSWKQLNLKGFMLESAYSIGSAGLGLYLMGRLGWDIAANVSAIKEEFYKNMFGASSNELRDYYEQVGSYYQGIADVPYLINELNEADKNSNPLIHKRIVALQAYIHYLILYQQYLSSAPAEVNRVLDPLVEYVWQIYHLKVIHSTRIAELLYYRLPDALKAWSFYEPFGERLVKVKPATNEKISAIINNDRQIYPLLADFNYNSKVRSKLNYTNIKIKTNKNLRSDEIMFKDFPETYVQPGPDGYAHIFIRLRVDKENPHQTIKLPISCVDPILNKQVYNQVYVLGAEWKKISIKLPAGKTYKLSMQNEGWWIMMRIVEDQWLGFKNIPTYFVANKLWFYIPPGIKFIYYAKTEGEQPVITNNSGKEIKPGEANKLNIFQIATGNDSGWWSITQSAYKFVQFYSTPELFFLHPDYVITSQKKD